MKRLLILFGIQNTLRNKEDCLEIAFNNSNNVNKPVLIKIEISNAIYFVHFLRHGRVAICYVFCMYFAVLFHRRLLIEGYDRDISLSKFQRYGS